MIYKLKKRCLKKYIFSHIIIIGINEIMHALSDGTELLVGYFFVIILLDVMLG